MFPFVFSMASFLFFLASCQGDPIGFREGIAPLFVNPNSLQTAASCGTCHETIWKEWQMTRHKVAFTNPLYQESHKREPLQWCENCHAPLVSIGLDANQKDSRVLSEEGVSCNVCHVRENKILVSRIPKDANQHKYIESKELKSSEFCARCHQFNFPIGTGAVPHQYLKFSSQPMQNTYQEWLESQYVGSETCQDCHMSRVEGRRSHTFPGGHSLDYLNRSIAVSFHKDQDLFFVRWKALGIGHSFPTGDLFRTLVLRFLDENGGELHRETLGYVYQNRQNPGPLDSSKELKSKQILLPALQGEGSEARSPIPLGPMLEKKAKKYALHIRYLSEEHSLQTKIPEKEYFPLVAQGIVVWKTVE